MFKKLFKGDQHAQAQQRHDVDVSPSTMSKTLDAVQQLGDQEELLEKRRGVLEKKILAETEHAKEYARAKNKRAALGALKKKKLYEGQLEQIEQNITRLTEQQMMLENQRATVSTVAALASAAKASKQTMSEMNIDKIDEVLDNINEQNDQMQQIHDAMANPIGAAADLDEDEMLKELEQMEAEELDTQLMEPAPVPAGRLPAKAQALPNVPAARPQAARPQKTAEEAELEALEAEMA